MGSGFPQHPPCPAPSSELKHVLGASHTPATPAPRHSSVLWDNTQFRHPSWGLKSHLRPIQLHPAASDQPFPPGHQGSGWGEPALLSALKTPHLSVPRAEPHRELRGREKPSHFGVQADLGLPLTCCVSFDTSLCLSEPQFPHLKDGDRTFRSWLLEIIRYKGRAIVTSRPRAFFPGRGTVNIIPVRPLGNSSCAWVALPPGGRPLPCHTCASALQVPP